MKIIKKLCEYIEEELCDSEKYIEQALKYSMEYPELAEVFNMLSNEEMKHMQILHNQIVKIIEGYRKEHGEPPAAMQAIYDYVHENMIEHSKEVKVMQQMYLEK